MIDISEPANPRRVGGYAARGAARAVAVSGNYAYLLAMISRCRGLGHNCYIVGVELHVIDVSNPADPERVGGNTSCTSLYDQEVSRVAVAVANDKVFVAAGDLFILHSYQPIRFEQVARAESGAMRLRIAGPPGVPGRVQRCSSWGRWTDWLPVHFGESPGEISDPDAVSMPARFYRLAVP